MPLIPDMGPNYSQNDGSDVSQRANNFYANNITMNLSYWTEATYDLRMFIGEQGLMTELYGVLPGRPHMYSFNRISDLSDCNGIMRRSYVTKEEAMSLLPDFSKDISSMEGGRGARDQKFQYMPEVFAFDQLDKLTYDEYYYRAFRKQKLLVDKETGDNSIRRKSVYQADRMRTL